MQLSKTIFSDSAIFIEKETVENQLWAKSKFLWAKFVLFMLAGDGELGGTNHLPPERPGLQSVIYSDLQPPGADLGGARDREHGRTSPAWWTDEVPVGQIAVGNGPE